MIDSYKTVYVTFAKDDDNTILYSTKGDCSDYSRQYRDSMWIRDVGLPKGDSFRFETKSPEEARHLQRAFMEVVKPWITTRGVIKFERKVDKEVIRQIMQKIINSFDSDNRHEIRKQMMLALHKLCPYQPDPGVIYLLEITNINGTRYKIGYTSDVERRIGELSMRYQGTVTVVDLKKSSDERLDEAMLQMLCSGFKSKNNLLGQQKEDEDYTSELYEHVDNVKAVWDNYWAHK